MCLVSLLTCRYVLSMLSRAQNAPRYHPLGVCSQAWAPQLASLGILDSSSLPQSMASRPPSQQMQPQSEYS